jgi:hypothetical protein
MICVSNIPIKCGYKLLLVEERKKATCAKNFQEEKLWTSERIPNQQKP